MSELLEYAVIVLIPFAVQLIVLSHTANRFQFLRFAVPILAVIASMVYFLASILSSNGLWEPWLHLLAFFLILLGLGLVLMGWGLAWPVYYLINLVKRKASDT